jgi:hypothetical protein
MSAFGRNHDFQIQAISVSVGAMSAFGRNHDFQIQAILWQNRPPDLLADDSGYAYFSP